LVVDLTKAMYSNFVEEITIDCSFLLPYETTPSTRVKQYTNVEW
jgi:hypothetical protein